MSERERRGLLDLASGYLKRCSDKIRDTERKMSRTKAPKGSPARCVDEGEETRTAREREKKRKKKNNLHEQSRGNGCDALSGLTYLIRALRMLASSSPEKESLDKSNKIGNKQQEQQQEKPEERGRQR